MGLLMLTLVLSILLGCATWLIIGDRFPLKSDYKWESRMNITLYVVILLAPIYLLIFYLF